MIIYVHILMKMRYKWHVWYVVCVYVARGVGTAKIIGRVHIAQMRFGNSVFPVSITVLEKNDVDFLFGLDTLRRYRCVIDLG